MAENRDKQLPHLTEAALAAKAEREARQAAALRANLRRRRAQNGDTQTQDSPYQDNKGETGDKETNG